MTSRAEARRQRGFVLASIVTSLEALGRARLPDAAIEPLVELHGLVGRLGAIDEIDAHQERIESGQPSRFPRPAVDLIDPELPEQHVEAALHMAVETLAKETLAETLGHAARAEAAVERIEVERAHRHRMSLAPYLLPDDTVSMY